MSFVDVVASPWDEHHFSKSFSKRPKPLVKAFFELILFPVGTPCLTFQIPLYVPKPVGRESVW